MGHLHSHVLSLIPLRLSPTTIIIIIITTTTVAITPPRPLPSSHLHTMLEGTLQHQAIFIGGDTSPMLLTLAVGPVEHNVLTGQEGTFTVSPIMLEEAAILPTVDVPIEGV